MKQKLGETPNSRRCSRVWPIDLNHSLEQQEISDTSKRLDMEADFAKLNQKCRDKDMFKFCRISSKYNIVNKLNEGGYGIVYGATEKQTGEVVAIKKGKNDNTEYALEGEIELLSILHHPNIVNLREVIIDYDLGKNTIFMVMEHMDTDIRAMLRKMEADWLTLRMSSVKLLMKQLLEGVCYLHENNVLHQDLKTANLLLNKDFRLKICDFGLSRRFLNHSSVAYTTPIVTLWYRAPELLLGTEEYSSAIDVWSIGCIMAELLLGRPLFVGDTEIQMLEQMFKILGVPEEESWPGLTKLPGPRPRLAFGEQDKGDLLHKIFISRGCSFSDSGFDLLEKFLTYDPEKRITARNALKHEWFQESPSP